MAKVKNVSGAALTNPEQNKRVAKGGTLDIPDERAWGYCQTADVWAPADKLTADLVAEQRAAVAALENPGAQPIEQPVAAENTES